MPYHRLAYRPMRELFDLLRAHGFKVFVASAGGRDFMRAVSEEIYGVPRESVIGSSAVLEWSEGRVLRTRALAQPLDDGPGKPVHIYICGVVDPGRPAATSGRMRARGELIELWVADLHLTDEEAWDLLNDSMGLDLGLLPAG